LFSGQEKGKDDVYFLISLLFYTCLRTQQTIYITIGINRGGCKEILGL